MAGFESPSDLTFNRGLIADPAGFARSADAASWLFLCGDAFAAVEGGMSYESVQEAVAESARIVSDPPTPFDLELAREHVAALDRLPRPTLVTCRTGLARRRWSTCTRGCGPARPPTRYLPAPRPTARRSAPPTSSSRGFRGLAELS
jgi:hypothetical protein